ncbi:hypothetical protein BC835DRAFT_540591 [Cytidiella melzeri]|nr:hypothetical protein BC835DRAFT_540591 [Cytidiella melzeri]
MPTVLAHVRPPDSTEPGSGPARSRGKRKHLVEYGVSGVFQVPAHKYRSWRTADPPALRVPPSFLLLDSFYLPTQLTQNSTGCSSCLYSCFPHPTFIRNIHTYAHTNCNVAYFPNYSSSCAPPLLFSQLRKTPTGKGRPRWGKLLPAGQPCL